MSITRRGCDGSDIYLYEHECGHICCDTCNLNGGRSFDMLIDSDVLEHIADHIKAGDKVPQHAIDYFNNKVENKINITSNVTKADLNHIPPSLPRAELKILNKNGEVVQALGIHLPAQGNNRDRIDRLFTTMKITLINQLTKHYKSVM